MQEMIRGMVQKALLELFGLTDVSFVVEEPGDLSHGDYATNVALVVSKQLGKNPKEIAEALAQKLQGQSGIASVSVAGPGFINFTLAKEFFHTTINTILSDKEWGGSSLNSGKKIMVEYTDPNPFKPFHIGHLMTNAIGESIARLVEKSDAYVVRANYQGDVGLHVAKAIWGMMYVLKNRPDESETLARKAQYIGNAYSIGSGAYDDEDLSGNVPGGPTKQELKEQINAINKKVYNRTDSEINELYDWGRRVTLEAFEEIYKTLGTKFDYYFFESEMVPIGLELVKENTGKVFEESDGAIVFKAEKYNSKLHTRVFITSQGLPTYETKELGLTKTKFEKEKLDISIVITAVEQKDYMAVATEAIRQIDTNIADRMKHLTHGMMRFASGKMSSRKGNVITGEALLKDTKDLVLEKIEGRDLSQNDKEQIAEFVSVAAIKFEILKQAIGGDIIYDQEKAISFEGDSGPYLQYSAVRARSVLEKAGNSVETELPENWETTALEKVLIHFPEVVERSILEWAPHHIVSYLLALAQTFNSWYGNTKIIDEADPTSGYKLALTKAFANVMESGLNLLAIKVPQKM